MFDIEVKWFDYNSELTSSLIELIESELEVLRKKNNEGGLAFASAVEERIVRLMIKNLFFDGECYCKIDFIKKKLTALITPKARYRLRELKAINANERGVQITKYEIENIKTNSAEEERIKKIIDYILEQNIRQGFRCSTINTIVAKIDRENKLVDVFIYYDSGHRFLLKSIFVTFNSAVVEEESYNLKKILNSFWGAEYTPTLVWDVISKLKISYDVENVDILEKLDYENGAKLDINLSLKRNREKVFIGYGSFELNNLSNIDNVLKDFGIGEERQAYSFSARLRNGNINKKLGLYFLTSCKIMEKVNAGLILDFVFINGLIPSKAMISLPFIISNSIINKHSGYCLIITPKARYKGDGAGTFSEKCSVFLETDAAFGLESRPKSVPLNLILSGIIMSMDVVGTGAARTRMKFLAELGTTFLFVLKNRSLPNSFSYLRSIKFGAGLAVSATDSSRDLYGSIKTKIKYKERYLSLDFDVFNLTDGVGLTGISGEIFSKESTSIKFYLDIAKQKAVFVISCHDGFNYKLNNTTSRSIYLVDQR